MTLAELYEKEEEPLRQALAKAKHADAALGELQKWTERLLLRFNETCESPAQRQAASAMCETFLAAAPLLDTAGETLVWERQEGGNKKTDKKTRVLLWSAVVCLLAAAAGVVVLFAGKGGTGVLGATCALLAAGAALFFLTGRRMGKPSGGEVKRQTETLLDVPKTVRAVRAAVTVMDQHLAETAREE